MGYPEAVAHGEGGEFAASLAKSREAALKFYQKLSDDSRFRTLMEPQLDIVTWAPGY
jgi:hypothetical protein